MPAPLPQPSGRVGQAAIEFAVGLLLFLLVLTGILHVCRMARTSLFLHAVLRGQAGERAMESVASVAPQPISDWRPGPDGIRYTADDQPMRGAAAFAASLDMLVGRSVQTPADWAHVSDDSRLPVSLIRLQQEPLLGTALGFARAAETLHVPVDTVIRQLVYGKDEVAIREEVWIPLMGGLY